MGSLAQTVVDKGKSNPLMIEDLLKILKNLIGFAKILRDPIPPIII